MKKEIIRSIIFVLVIVCITIAVIFGIKYFADFFKKYNYHTVEANISELDNAQINIDNLNIKFLNSSEEETALGSKIATVMFDTLNDSEIQELNFAYLVYDNNKNILANKNNDIFLPKYFVRKEYNSFDLSKYIYKYSGTSLGLDETYIESGDRIYNIFAKINEEYKDEISYPIHIQLYDLQYKEVDTSYNSNDIKYTDDIFEFIINK